MWEGELCLSMPGSALSLFFKLPRPLAFKVVTSGPHLIKITNLYFIYIPLFNTYLLSIDHIPNIMHTNINNALFLPLRNSQARGRDQYVKWSQAEWDGAKEWSTVSRQSGSIVLRRGLKQIWKDKYNFVRGTRQGKQCRESGSETLMAIIRSSE